MTSHLIDPGLLPQGYIDIPDQEEHAGYGTDRSGNAKKHSPLGQYDIGGTKQHNALGLYNNFWWPSKYYETSVKCQGVRGSCVAFAITSAIESITAVRRNRWVNLSEQDVYYNIKANEPNSGDGADLVDWATYLSDRKYSPPYEDEWDYNPAAERTDTDSGYSHSCDNYGETCSNSPGEGGYACTTFNGSLYCGFSPPNVSASGWTAGGAYLLYEMGFLGQLPVNTMRTLLAIGDSMVASIPVCNSFDNVNNNGFVTSLDCSSTRGDHAIHIVGFVSDDAIKANPSYALPAGQTGVGGGYFIVKNSWSTGYGDGGYVYVPALWMELYAYNITVYPANLASLLGNTPPYLTITAPANYTNVGADLVTAVKFSAKAIDPQDQLGCCQVQWTSDIDGVLGSGFDISYNFGFSPGTRVITATAKDTNGTTFSKSITLTIVNTAPKAIITVPTANQTFYTNVGYVLNGYALDGVAPVDCSNLTWTSTASEGPWSGCRPTVTFTTIGSRTLTLSASSKVDAIGQAQVTINVINPPLSGPPVVSILSPKDNTYYAPNSSVFLFYSMTDPGGTTGSTYKVVWKIKVGNGAEQVITPLTTTILGIPVDYFIPSDYVPFQCGGTSATLTLYVTDPEGLTGSQTIKILVSYPVC